MITLATTILLSIVAIETPDIWLDSRVDEEDRASLEQLVSFAPPPISETATWLLEDDEETPSWEQFRGKVVVVQSWTNTTAGGRLAIGAVIKAVAKSKTPDEIVLVTVHTPQGHNKLHKYLQKKSVSPYTIVDTTGERLFS